MDVMLGQGAPLDCNHGEQKGDICVCDPGWGSSGIDSHMQEHWCDVLDGSNVQISTGPIELNYVQELLAIIVSFFKNFGAAFLRVCVCVCVNERVSTSVKALTYTQHRVSQW